VNLPKTVLLLTLVYWGILFTLTHIPPAQAPEMGASDKLLHLLAFTLLAFLVSSNLLLAKRWNRVSILLSMVILAGYAGFDELTQLLVGRTAAWKDWQADLSGILAGTAACAILIYFFRRHPLVQPLLQQEKQ